MSSSQSRAAERDGFSSLPWLGLVEAGHQVRVVADLRVIDVQPGMGPRLRITLQELGYLVGLSRQRVNEALTALDAAGAAAPALLPGPPLPAAPHSKAAARRPAAWGR